MPGGTTRCENAATARLADVAQQIAAGNLTAAAGNAWSVPQAIAREALTQGFVWVMLYGAISVSLLAALSAFAFGQEAAEKASARRARL